MRLVVSTLAFVVKGECPAREKRWIRQPDGYDPTF